MLQNNPPKKKSIPIFLIKTENPKTNQVKLKSGNLPQSISK